MLSYYYEDFTPEQQSILDGFVEDYFSLLDDSERLSIYNDYLDNSGYSEDRIYNNNEEEINTLCEGCTAFDILLKSNYGDYRTADDFVMITNGNLYSTNDLNNFCDFDNNDFKSFVFDTEDFQNKYWQEIEETEGTEEETEEE